MSKKIAVALMAVVAGFAVFGCNKVAGVVGGENDPKAVAGQFWDASRTGEMAKMKPFVTAGSLQSERKGLATAKVDGKHVLGTPAIEGERALIPTTLKMQGMDIALTTVALKENGLWKVDVPQTMATMFESMQEK